MSEPLRSITRKIELTDQVRWERRRGVGIATGMIIGAVLFTVLGAFVAGIISGGKNQSILLASLVWVLAGAMAYLAYSNLAAAKINRGALVLRFSDSRDVLMPWNDPNFGLTVRDYATDPNSTSGEKEHLWLAANGRGRAGAIPRDLADLLEDAARSHGLAVHEATEMVSGGKAMHTMLTKRIGRLECTPDWNQRLRAVYPTA